MQTIEFLLIKRGDYEVGCLPGLDLDPGERIAQVALREARKETELEVELDYLGGNSSLTGSNQLFNHIICFATHPIGGSLQPQDGEALEVSFFKHNILSVGIQRWHQRRILDAFAEWLALVWNKNFPIKFDPPMSREELISLRDRSPMSRLEHFKNHFENGGDDFLEVGKDAFEEQ